MRCGASAKTPAVPLADGVWRIPTLPFDLVNSFAFVEDDGSVTLVDCGLKRAPARIVAGLAAIGKAPADVTRIVLTHAHTDHAGGVAELRRVPAGACRRRPGGGARGRRRRTSARASRRRSTPRSRWAGS